MENINIINFDSGFIKNFNTVQERYLSDLKEYFYSKNDVERILEKNNPLIYKVYETKYDSPGSLSYAVTEIMPGKIGEEYYFTKGHFHSKSAAELYVVFKGEGILILENRAGNTKSYNMFRGAIINVEPDYAHRSINTGKDKLIFLAIYQTDAGHDYESIKEKGFSYLVLDRNGPAMVKNPRQ